MERSSPCIKMTCAVTEPMSSLMQPMRI
ncbi:unnamed protein product [Staurois parvus]|uniref:Uncharacterized protein n=1 Tax=Staurois parvus TaxID=386267 RepID=A0ABN9B0G7_9NEOB|nr:unnamed protein product [Staurois parvus]CAI9542574.1 unnamed protein product [Staurois parvus]